MQPHNRDTQRLQVWLVLFHPSNADARSGCKEHDVNYNN